MSEKSWKKNKNGYSRSTSIGNYLYENGIEIESGYNYNGSGRECFGGNEKWMSVKLEVRFPLKEKKLEEDLMERLKKVVDEFMDDNEILKK